MTRFKFWLVGWLRLPQAISDSVNLGCQKLRGEYSEGISRLAAQAYEDRQAMQKQIDDLRRLLTVQEKPKVRAQAASFREVRQFVGDDE